MTNRNHLPAVHSHEGPDEPPQSMASFAQYGELLKHVLSFVSAIYIIWQVMAFVQTRTSQVDILNAKMSLREQEYTTLSVKFDKLLDTINSIERTVVELKTRQGMSSGEPNK